MKIPVRYNFCLPFPKSKEKWRENEGEREVADIREVTDDGGGLIQSLNSKGSSQGTKHQL